MRKCQIALLSLGFMVAMALPALADYKPKKASRPRSASSTASVRGSCVPGTHTSLAAVAPRTITGGTSNPTPTLVWYHSDSQSFPMDINLYEYEYSDAELMPAMAAVDLDDFATSSQKKHLKLRHELQTKPGWMRWSVPDEYRLEPGKRYLWKVVVYCNPNRPSMAAITEAELQLESLPLEIQQALEQMTDPVQRSQLYGEQGFWYEALAEVLDVEALGAIARRQELLQALLQIESAPLGLELASLDPKQLKISPEQDSPLVQLAKHATRQLATLVNRHPH